MRIELLEKIMFLTTTLTVVGVGAGVTVISLIPGGLDSGISDAAVNSDEATLTWLDDLRRKKGQGIMFQDHFVRPPKVERTQDGKLKDPVAFKKAAKEAIASTAPANAPIPVAQRVPHTPWLRSQPGVRYKPPRRVSRLMYRKFQSFKDAWKEAQAGGGQFVETEHGTAYQVNWVNEKSRLAQKIGLQPGDQVLAVNGQPVPKSVGGGQQMYGQLKGERRFAVMILRKGQKMVIPFEVQN